MSRVTRDTCVGMARPPCWSLSSPTCAKFTIGTGMT